MADWRQKLTEISKTKGDSAPEPAKRAGMGCLIGVVFAVAILALIMAIGLFASGNWIIGSIILLFFLLSAMTAIALIWPHRPKPL